MNVTELSTDAIAKPAVRRRDAREVQLAADILVCHGHDANMLGQMPSRSELLVGLVLATGILAVALALRVVPPPWHSWFR